MTATSSAGTPAITPTGAAAGADQFRVSLSGVANAVKQVESLVGSGSGVASQVADVVLDVLAFGQIGAPVGAQNAAMNAAHVQSLTQVLQLISKIKGLVEQAAEGYAQADAATAQGFGGTGTEGAAGAGATTTSTDATPQTADQTDQADQADQADRTDTSGPYGNGLSRYTSPNPHPAAVGHDRNGHTLYDMTGHRPPSTRPAGDLDGWIHDAKSALADHGVDTSSMRDSDLRALISHESSGDPHALNNWDSNARQGIPSKGLMQTIDPTFNRFALPGHTDIWNPVDNIVAGVRYGIDRYGSFDHIPGVARLHRGEGYVGY